jgi:hypothetical protein
MICKLDRRGYCKRHGEIHQGRVLYWSQLDTEQGEQVRLSLDQAAPGRSNKRRRGKPRLSFDELARQRKH